MDEISVLSTEYLRIPFTANVDPSTLGAVKVAFGPPANSSGPTTVWHPAAIEDGAVRILLGPGGDVELAPGAWMVWVDLIDTPERPVERAGNIRVY